MHGSLLDFFVICRSHSILYHDFTVWDSHGPMEGISQGGVLYLHISRPCQLVLNGRVQTRKVTGASSLQPAATAWWSLLSCFAALAACWVHNFALQEATLYHQKIEKSRMLRHIQVETFSRRPQQGRGQRARAGRKYQLTSRAVLSFELIPVLMFCMISKNQLLAQALYRFSLTKQQSSRCTVEFAHAQRSMLFLRRQT